MHQYCAFGNACGATGVLEKRDIFRAKLRFAQRQAAPLSKRIIELDRTRQVVGGHRFFDAAYDVVCDQVFGEAKQIAYCRNHNVPYLCFGDYLFERGGKIFQNHDRFCATVIQLVFQLARRVQWIHVDDHESCTQNRANRNGVLQHIRHHQRDTGTAFQAPGLQPRPKCL